PDPAGAHIGPELLEPHPLLRSGEGLLVRLREDCDLDVDEGDLRGELLAAGRPLYESGGDPRILLEAEGRTRLLVERRPPVLSDGSFEFERCVRILHRPSGTTVGR